MSPYFRSQILSELFEAKRQGCIVQTHLPRGKGQGWGVGPILTM
jgi:hypothetical protein